MSKNYDVELHGKKVSVRMTSSAEKALSERAAPLYVEMELYFSCLIRKRLKFHQAAATGNSRASNAQVTDKLYVTFHPVMTKACHKDYEGDAPPLTEFPIENAAPFVPRWISVDYSAGHWQGEFGYD